MDNIVPRNNLDKNYKELVWIEMEIRNLDKNFASFTNEEYLTYRNYLLRKLWYLE